MQKQRNNLGVRYASSLLLFTAAGIRTTVAKRYESISMIYLQPVFEKITDDFEHCLQPWKTLILDLTIILVPDEALDYSRNTLRSTTEKNMTRTD